MASLQDILAAKKAAANKVNPEATAHLSDYEDAVSTGNEKTIAEPVKKEEPAIAAPKALSFAEKMALKKKQEIESKTKTEQTGSTLSQPAPVGNVALPLVASSTEVEKPSPNAMAPVPVASQSVEGAAPIPVKEDIGTQEAQTATPEIQQAYADIKGKIDLLNQQSGENLEGAMKELKQALMKNPAAVSLMEDSDIGQLVIALRKITGEAIADAVKEGKPGRKKKENINLADPNQVAAIFDEL